MDNGDVYNNFFKFPERAYLAFFPFFQENSMSRGIREIYPQTIVRVSLSQKNVIIAKEF